ncbi:MAG: hypothetical protein ACTH31_02625 [Pseudoclavibacter sp.]
MQIRITAEGTAEVADADNLKALDVATGGATPEQVDAALTASGLGRLEGEHAWLPVEVLRAAARGDRGDDWTAGFDGMIGYARSKGWVNESDEVRAHLA